MQIIDFPADDKEIIQQAAALLVEGASENIGLAPGQIKGGDSSASPQNELI